MQAKKNRRRNIIEIGKKKLKHKQPNMKTNHLIFFFIFFSRLNKKKITNPGHIQELLPSSS
ncbi:hypothetical protein QR98_0082510 [Sarcoptes scabiei]|uniref:Uncharacterized protein n=1 Tax=Sarcoptes scabiei TaxID=52283 RepID=A0A132AFK5_SARSC|nr:hypothetical protein QR98_0082510 [Sarcoptes scabiei]